MSSSPPALVQRGSDNSTGGSFRRISFRGGGWNVCVRVCACVCVFNADTLHCNVASVQTQLASFAVGRIGKLCAENASSPRKKILRSQQHLLPFHFGTDSGVPGGKLPALPVLRENMWSFLRKIVITVFDHLSLIEQFLQIQLCLHCHTVSATLAGRSLPSSFHIYLNSLVVAERFLNSLHKRSGGRWEVGWGEKCCIMQTISACKPLLFVNPAHVLPLVLSFPLQPLLGTSPSLSPDPYDSPSPRRPLSRAQDQDKKRMKL